MAVAAAITVFGRRALAGQFRSLVGDPERVAEEPFIALRILGEISTDLAHAIRA